MPKDDLTGRERLEQVIEEETASDAPKPAMLVHCETVYAKMLERSTPVTEGILYEGMLTHLFEEVGLSTPYYTHVMTKLKAMDCVRQIRRGGGNTPSRWLLLQEPVIESWRSVTADMAERVKRHTNRNDLIQMLVDLGRRTSTSENRIGYLEQEVERLAAQLEKGAA